MFLQRGSEGISDGRNRVAITLSNTVLSVQTSIVNNEARWLLNPIFKRLSDKDAGCAPFRFTWLNNLYLEHALKTFVKSSS